MGTSRKKSLIVLSFVIALAVLITGVEIASQWMNREYLEAEGYLEEGDKQEIYVEKAARVKEVLVKEGDRVKEGQVLAVIQVDDYSLQLEEAFLKLEQARLELEKYRFGVEQKERAYRDAQEAVEQAERELERARLLYSEGVISKDQLESYRSRLDVARNSLEDAEDALKLFNINLQSLENQVKLAQINVKELEENIMKHNPNIQSPMDGIVTKISIKEGAFTDPSQPVMVVSDLSSLIVKVKVKAKDISKIELGQKAQITADVLEGQYFEGKVDAISPMVSLDPSRRLGETVVEVTVRLLGNSPLLLPGMPVEVRILPDEWSHQAEISRTSMLPDRDIEYFAGKQGGQIWTVYTNRIGDAPPAVFLSVTQLSTGKGIATLKVSREGEGVCKSPVIVNLDKGDKLIFWELEEEGKKYIQYSRISSNLACTAPDAIMQSDYDLIHPVKVEGQGDGSIAALWKKGKCFGFDVYRIDSTGTRLTIHTDAILKDDSVALGFKDFTANIEGFRAMESPEGFIFIWAERQDTNGTLCFLKIDKRGNVLIPRKEIVKYNILSQRGDFDVEFFQDCIYLFWTEINNPIDKNFQISMLKIDYSGGHMHDKRVIAPGTSGFRGAINITRDNRNNIHAVWIDQDPTSKRINSDIFYQLFDEEGNPLIPSRVIVGELTTQKYPEMHVLGDGTKILTWIDLEGDSYKTVYKSTHPGLVEILEKANYPEDIKNKLINHVLNFVISLAIAVLLFIPYNIMPIMLLCLFLYLAVFERIKHFAYYFVFLLLIFPVKYYNGLVFKSIFRGIMDISGQLLLAINCITLALLMAALLLYQKGDKGRSFIDSYCYFFAGWLYVDTLCAVAVALYNMF